MRLPKVFASLIGTCMPDSVTLEAFVTEFETLTDEGREKEAALLAGEHPDLYLRYWVEICGEEVT